MRARRTFVATGLVALLALAGVTAAVAADPAGPPPPRIAFVANGIVPADALAAGPIAGQLGAPVYTTAPDALPGTTRDALAAYAPQLVIVLGGSVAITDGVVNAIAAATGLPTVAPTPPPTTGVVRAAGGDRYETAAIVGDLLSAYDPAYLGVDLQSVDADLLDGMDSSAFLASDGTAADASRLGGLTPDAYLTDARMMRTTVTSGGSLCCGSDDAVTAQRTATGRYLVTFARSTRQCTHTATATEGAHIIQTIGSERYAGPVEEVQVRVYDHAGDPVNGAFALLIMC
jgi:hypothetical protein